MEFELERIALLEFEFVSSQVGENLVNENLAGGTDPPSAGRGFEKNVGSDSLANVDNGKILCESDPFYAQSKFEISSSQVGGKLVRENLAGCSIPRGSIEGSEMNFKLGSLAIVDIGKKFHESGPFRRVRVPPLDSFHGSTQDLRKEKDVSDSNKEKYSEGLKPWSSLFGKKPIENLFSYR